jgi:hypothetical protein
VACGNGKVSMDYLSSAPTDPATLFTRAYVGLPPARAVPAAPIVVRLPPAPPSKKWGGKEWHGIKDEQMFYSRATGRNFDSTDQELNADKVDYFIGPNGNPTVNPNRHIHVIHDERKQEVTLVLTDRTQTKVSNEHLLEVTLPGNPSGNQVNKAIDAMVATLNSIPRGPKSMTWP